MPIARQRPVERDREHRAERAAGGHAERERRGERVAQQALEDDARRGERGADEGAGQRPRQPRDEEDLRVDVVGERDREIERAPQADRRRADERREQNRGRRQQRRRPPGSGRAVGRSVIPASDRPLWATGMTTRWPEA